MSGLHYAVEDRKADAVAHLAFARSQKTRNGISGDLRKRKDSCFATVLFLVCTQLVRNQGLLSECKKRLKSYHRCDILEEQERRMDVKKYLERISQFTEYVGKSHIGAYAAQSAYFLMLSLIPIILLLLGIIQYTPVTKADVMTALVLVFPEESMQSFIVGIVNQVYNQSMTIIPVTAITALWSAGKGVLAINRGLNCVYNTKETRNYIILRIRASFYTFVFILAIVMGLVISVFGNNISLFLCKYFPILEETIMLILDSRTVITFCVWFILSLLVYRFLPNKKGSMWKHVPGAVFTSAVCLIISFGFSTYLTFFHGFEGLYGSMTAIILVMLWLYFSMYAMLLGGLLNSLLWTKQ